MTIDPRDFEQCEFEHELSAYELRELDPEGYEATVEAGYKRGVAQARAELTLLTPDEQAEIDRQKAARTAVANRILVRVVRHVHGTEEYSRLQRDTDEIELDVLTGRRGLFEGYADELEDTLRQRRSVAGIPE